MAYISSEEVIRQIKEEGEGNYPIVVVSDDYCIGVNPVSFVRWNQDKDRLEIVCNCDN